MVVKTEFGMIHSQLEGSHSGSNDGDEKSTCVDLFKHNVGINFCEKCAPIIPGVYRPQALMSTVHSRRAHHELTRQMQNKIAAQNIRDRRKAYAIYLTQGIETLTLDNMSRQKRIDDAKAKQQTLQQEYDMLAQELQRRQMEQSFTDAVMMFELSDADASDTCVESSDDEYFDTPSVANVSSPLLCQYTVDEIMANPITPLTPALAGVTVGSPGYIDTFDTLSTHSPTTSLTLDSSPLPPVSPIMSSQLSPYSYTDVGGLEEMELSSFSYSPYSLSER
ncbi:hypothetical protein SARC_03678 [Sphaeroforma arctica JP610]|uniref:BZIP domain-containing protein n=1 Tax=Sphaeroforma arctica JP610 TaxID=667725 RepID=A0A0L0G4Z3_9EUKA|nr:hypothetical protein SARC_03678 [Sphaeroforma arctica JP610]KNC84085.1 hypothetical protein SARC_03678 [Sphaeroforma arctica JP610]|eukprot:XP_014157987.1 hypothetical protein SARC_03678 [Sphaeroforma arctica JP610]